MSDYQNPSSAQNPNPSFAESSSQQSNLASPLNQGEESNFSLDSSGTDSGTETCMPVTKYQRGMLYAPEPPRDHHNKAKNLNMSFQNLKLRPELTGGLTETFFVLRKQEVKIIQIKGENGENTYSILIERNESNVDEFEALSIIYEDILDICMEYQTAYVKTPANRNTPQWEANRTALRDKIGSLVWSPSRKDGSGRKITDTSRLNFTAKFNPRDKQSIGLCTYDPKTGIPIPEDYTRLVQTCFETVLIFTLPNIFKNAVIISCKPVVSAAPILSAIKEAGYSNAAVVSQVQRALAGKKSEELEDINKAVRKMSELRKTLPVANPVQSNSPFVPNSGGNPSNFQGQSPFMNQQGQGQNPSMNQQGQGQNPSMNQQSQSPFMMNYQGQNPSMNQQGQSPFMMNYQGQNPSMMNYQGQNPSMMNQQSQSPFMMNQQSQSPFMMNYQGQGQGQKSSEEQNFDQNQNQRAQPSNMSSPFQSNQSGMASPDSSSMMSPYQNQPKNFAPGMNSQSQESMRQYVVNGNN